MRVIVTGGRGFVGMNVAGALARRGALVWAVDREPIDGWVDGFLSGVEGIAHLQVDLAVPGMLREALSLDAVDCVIHAAVVTATTEDVERDAARDIVDTNVGGTIEALEVAQQLGARRFIYISSPAAIGPVANGEAIGEDVTPRPTTLYGITKYASEQIILRWAGLYDMETVTVRIAQPYGPGERPTASRIRTSPIWEWLQAASRGEPLTTGRLDVGRDWTYIQDTAEGIARIVEQPHLSASLYHLSLGQNVEVSDIVAILEARFGSLDLDTHPLARDLNPNISGPQRPPLNSDRYHADFGWRPSTSIADGMDRYLTWWSAASGDAPDNAGL